MKINTKYYLQVVQVYVPTSTHEDAKVGGHQQGGGAVVGQYGFRERNERGTRLVHFATSETSVFHNLRHLF